MSDGKRYTVHFRRKRIGKTDYRKRLKLLLGRVPRLVVRKSLNHTNAQIVAYNAKGDRVVAAAHTRELEKFGWKVPKGNVPSAYLVGLLLGAKAKEKNIKQVIVDLGLQSSVKGSRIYAVVKGMIDHGIKIPHTPEVLPAPERISGKHIAAYASLLQKDKALFERQFGDYLRKSVDPTQFPRYFEEVKSKISGGHHA